MSTVMTLILTKKKELRIEEATVKKDVFEGDICLLRINLRYPDIVCGKKDPLLTFACGLYKNIASAFLQYAESEIFKRAREAYIADSGAFAPFAAIMKYEITRCDGEFLSVILDMSVGDGRNNLTVERKTQVWERAFGTKCKSDYFMPKKEIESALAKSLERDEIKRLDYELFALRDKGLEFFLRENGGYRSICIDLLQKND